MSQMPTGLDSGLVTAKLLLCAPRITTATSIAANLTMCTALAMHFVPKIQQEPRHYPKSLL